MIDSNCSPTRAWRFPTPAHLPVYLAFIALACGQSSKGAGAGGGGNFGSSGAPSSSGTSGGGEAGYRAPRGMAGTGGSPGVDTASSGLGGQAGKRGGPGGQSAGGGPSAGAGQSSMRGQSGSGGQLATGGGEGGAAGAGGSSDSVGSTGCGKTPTLKNGTQSIQSGGQARSFMIRIPDNYDKNHPYRLIFGFHWVGGTANDVDSGGTSGYTWSYYGLREQADKSASFRSIFIAPQGIGNAWGNSNNQDVVFTDDIIKLVEGDLCVDTKHVFSTGFSYGGGMTKALGCQRPNVFRAIAVYSGADFLSGGCDNTTTSPIAYIGLHSITDGTNPYSSGETIRDRFVNNDGCTPQTPPMPAQNSLTHVCTTYQGCKAGYPVEWCAFNGGGHTPAPVDGATAASGGGDTTWTKGEVWNFLTQL
jgi:poly(3-hydroxybutyrate) depolymerase